MKDWRKSKEYRIWRKNVIRRDKYCVICGSMKHRHAHHLEDGSRVPELRFDEDNGITLCSDCHTQFHCNYKKSFREKCTMDDFINFTNLISYIVGLNIINNTD